MPNTVLHTPRLTLAALREQDKAALIALFRHDGVKETYMVPDPLDDALADRMFARLMALSQDDSRYVFGIFLDDALIGILNDTEIEGDTVEMGYALLHERGLFRRDRLSQGARLCHRHRRRV